MENYLLYAGAAAIIFGLAHTFPRTPYFTRGTVLAAWVLIFQVAHWAMTLVSDPTPISPHKAALAGSIVGLVTVLLGWLQSVYRDYRIQHRNGDTK